MMRALRCHFSPRHFCHYAILLLLLPIFISLAADAIAAMLIFADAAITPFSPRHFAYAISAAAITLSPFRHCSISPCHYFAMFRAAMPPTLPFRYADITPFRYADYACHFIFSTPLRRR
jgi:hypothetical protein